MSASTNSVVVPPNARQWLDALVSGSCDPPTFLRGVDNLVQSSGDEAWEVLSLLDQYYRRGKLPLDQFRSLKAHVDRIALASSHDAAILPRPKAVTEPAAAKSAPTKPAAAEPPPANAAVAVPALATTAPDMAIAEPLPNELAPIENSVAPAEAPVAPAATPVAPAATPVAPIAASVRPAEARGAPRIGAVLRGRYELVGILGKGGMGTVFEAIDRFRVDLPQASDRLAVKVMHTVVTDRPELFDELRSEFQHLQSLSHPNIVRVHEFDRDGETAFFTMELLNGTPLNRLFGSRKDVPIARPYALAIIRDIGAAVAHAHARNVVHGDLNPQNIFVTQAGEVRVLDFGAAHKLKRGPWVSDFETEPQVSAATPAFGSCQVLEGETADVRDDVFSFACVIYMLLTGRHPFQSRTAIEARSLRLQPIRPQGLTLRQWRWLRGGLAFERERRPLDVERWLRDLNLRGAATHLPNLAALASEPPRRDYSSLYLALALGLVAIAGIGLWTKTKQDALVAVRATPDSPAADGADSEGTAAPAAADTQQAAAPIAMEPATRASAETPVHRPPAHEPPALVPPAAAAAAHASTVPLAEAARAAPARVTATGVAATGAEETETGNDLAARPTAPRSRIQLTAEAVEVAPGEPVARVTLRRKGNLRGPASFMWWTEPGTARAGVDFSASAPHIETFGNGQSLDTLLIPIVSNPARHEERSFYLVIDDAGPDSSAAVLGRTTTMITILPGD